jgi:MFS family permease
VLATTWRVLLFALIAGLSPVAIVSTLAVLTSRRGRTNGLAFVTGFMLGQAAAFLAAFFVGSAATTDREANEHLAAALELAFGLALLAIAWPQRKSPEAGVAGGRSRTKALLERLRGLRPVTAFSFGALLGVGGVKRLTITIVAGATVGVASLLPVEELALGLVYLLVAGVLVWLPVGVYLVAGARADEWMSAAESWLTTNERRFTFFSTLVFGLLLTSDALFRLL